MISHRLKHPRTRAVDCWRRATKSGFTALPRKPMPGDAAGHTRSPRLPRHAKRTCKTRARHLRVPTPATKRTLTRDSPTCHGAAHTAPRFPTPATRNVQARGDTLHCSAQWPHPSGHARTLADTRGRSRTLANACERLAYRRRKRVKTHRPGRSGWRLAIRC